MKKIITFIVLSISLFMLSACSAQVIDINIGEALSQEPYSYYVYFSKDDCPACVQIKSDITSYAKFAHANDDKRPIFEVNLSKEENAFAFSYPNIPNPQENWRTHLIGISTSADIRIGSTPSLILVREGTIIRVVSGVSGVLNELSSHRDS